MEENKDSITELNPEEMERVSGGWEFTSSNIEWLKGINIKCPYCGAEDRETVKYYGSSHKLLADFACVRCRKEFTYSYLSGEIRLVYGNTFEYVNK